MIFRLLPERHVLSSYRKLAQQTAELRCGSGAYRSQPTDTALSAHCRIVSAALSGLAGVFSTCALDRCISRPWNHFAVLADERGVVGGTSAVCWKIRRCGSKPQIPEARVAVQGLSAMERLLFTGGAPPDAGSCLLLVAIGANLHDMADGIVRGTGRPVTTLCALLHHAWSQ